MSKNVTIIVVILILVLIVGYMVWLRGRYQTSGPVVVSPTPVAISPSPHLVTPPVSEGPVATSSAKPSASVKNTKLASPSASVK